MAKTFMPPPKHVPSKKKEQCNTAPHPYQVQKMMLQRISTARLKRHAEYLLKGVHLLSCQCPMIFCFLKKMSITAKDLS